MSSVSTHTEAENTPEISTEQIDASCRLPLLTLLGSSAAWLTVSALLALLASLNFHSPKLLAGCPFFTYGHVQAAAFNTLLYGFVAQAAIGVMLWLIARLGRTTLLHGGFATVGGIFWNLGVTLGTVGIFLGDGTGFEWLEFPKYAAPVLFAAYGIIGIVGGMTFASRKTTELYPSQWFLLAALFWFPWIYGTVGGLIYCTPARGVMQAVVHQWYAHNLVTVWLGSIGIAAVFYFIPKLSGKPLASRAHAMTAFWFLLIFGGMGGMHHGMPVPSWLPSLSTVMAFLLIAPILSFSLNVFATMEQNYSFFSKDVTAKFIYAGSIALLLATLMRAVGSIPAVSDFTQFTAYVVAEDQLFLLGFAGLILLGAIYYIVPRITGFEWPVAGAIKLHFLASVIGLVFIVLPMAIAGAKQGSLLASKDAVFADTTAAFLKGIRPASLGQAVILLGSLILLVNVKLLVFRMVKAQVVCCVLNDKSAKGREAVA